MPKFLNQLNHGESKLKSKLLVRKQKNKAVEISKKKKKKATSLQFHKGCQNFAALAKIILQFDFFLHFSCFS